MCVTQYMYRFLVIKAVDKTAGEVGNLKRVRERRVRRMFWILRLFSTHRSQDKWPTFAGDVVQCIFLNENRCIFITMSLKFVLYNKLALLQVMSWCWKGDKSLPEPMLTQLIDLHIDGLVREERNSIARALDLRLSCTNPSIYASPSING